MKKKPNKVTIFGASHSGRSSTTAFHYFFHVGPRSLIVRSTGIGNREVSYIVLQDVPRDQRLVDARVLVGFKMYKGLFRDTLMSSIALESVSCENTNAGWALGGSRFLSEDCLLFRPI